MRMNRRDTLRLAAASAATLVAPQVLSQTYPSRPITIVVPWPPGAGTDAATRIVAEALAKELGQVVNVDNRAGANGAIGSAYVAQGPKDGYRLLTATADTHSINPQIRKNLAYNPVRDFEPLALFATLSMVWVARADLPYATMAEAVAASRKLATPMTFGSWGIGSTAHLAGALLETASGMTLNHVPFQGATPAVTALGGGHIDMMPASRVSSATMRAAGKVKVLGLASSQRAGGTLADVPTLEEQGIRGAESGSWYGLVAPAGLPQDVRARLTAALSKVLVIPEVRTKIAATGLDPAMKVGDEFRTYMAAQWDTYGKVIRSKNISLSE